MCLLVDFSRAAWVAEYKVENQSEKPIRFIIRYELDGHSQRRSSGLYKLKENVFLFKFKKD